jgi:hypothetical protein
VVETDCEVEQVIRIVGIGGNGIEIDLLCFVPARLAGVQVAEGEIELGRFRLRGEQVFRRLSVAVGLPLSLLPLSAAA